MTKARTPDADWDVINAIENLVRQYVPGPFNWTAKQSSGENDWATSIGKGAYCFTLDERARQMGDDFIRELAEQVLGYPPDSVPDLEQRLEIAEKHMDTACESIKRAESNRDYWYAQIHALEAQLSQAAKKAKTS